MAHSTTVVPAALSRSVRREADALARWLARARAGDEKGVHRARVATRRLREAMPLLAVAGASEARGLRRDLRRLTRALGPVRELDVARGVLKALAPRFAWPPTTAARVDQQFERRRSRSLEALLEEADRLDAAALPAQIHAMLAGVDADAQRAAAAVFLAPRLRRRARALARAQRGAGTMYAVQPLHDVRLAAKKLRYLLELGMAATGAPVAADIRTLKRLQGLLGRLHDLQIVQHGLQDVEAGGADALTSRRLAQMHRDVETACRALHARYLKIASATSDQAVRLAREAAGLFGPRRRTGRMVRMQIAAERVSQVRR